MTKPRFGSVDPIGKIYCEFVCVCVYIYENATPTKCIQTNPNNHLTWYFLIVSLPIYQFRKFFGVPHTFCGDFLFLLNRIWWFCEWLSLLLVHMVKIVVRVVINRVDYIVYIYIDEVSQCNPTKISYHKHVHMAWYRSMAYHFQFDHRNAFWTVRERGKKRRRTNEPNTPYLFTHKIVQASANAQILTHFDNIIMCYYLKVRISL